ncbi:uncharacterized protein LOC126985758 isoform X8 [Eriocheir sinensis]|uniref:uncharacterized protein LOC126985758 isoform X5 n=1 Tax=Eriocheir sinensis TaxID=95602 RepID=UPI0021C85BE8|nr:uncharacterized protein LOC126985758 isoform X5 [Eriocheir sinensis]XP_050697082.1 uncharacterized protein LOC126985758 isoform X6 [Eriocheir sinensis]XP_050697094.1 uncharacterized protein LOC126985758 isoform X7 [Eriocheir sinensis]XP_050697105.1 uncharacterized protein LOC126985758 isoform X8 [Eriocheir sinensis]
MADSEVKVSSNSASEAVTPQSLVTEDHVRAVLAADKGAEARLAAWKVVDFTKKGDNYACIVSSVEVTYELGGQSSEASYVVKLNPCVSNPLADAVNDIAFVKEGNFYLGLIPELNCMLKEIGQREINFPKCFKVCLEKGKECIFLEDLRSRGYKMSDRKQGLDEAHTTLVLRELARLHAASLLLQKKYPGEDFNEKYPCLQKDMHYFMETCEAFVKLVNDSLKFAQTILNKVGGYERAVAWIDTLLPRLVDIIYEQLRFGEPKVVCHGDCWNNNLLFRYDKAGNPDSVMLLDLQLVSFGAPTPELNYLIFTSLRGEVRKPNLEALLNRYHNTLTGIMKIAGHEEPLTREELQKDFKKKNLFGIIFGMMSVPIVVMEGEGDVDSSDASADYIEEQMLKTRTEAMKALDTNPLLKPRFLTMFDEMMESGLIP